METSTEFCLLGPLVVRHDGAVVPVPPGRQRAVLAALLLRAGKVVSLEELTEVLWGACPPPSARVTVQNYVMRLRRALGDGSRISTHPHGYSIRAAASELDLARFEEHLATARAAMRDGDWQTAAARTRAGLALWRGEPLADVESDLLAAREMPRLAELRLQASELRIDADLHLGRHSEAIAWLRRLAAEHPLRERLHGLLMLALYRDGQQAEALRAYALARQVLISELGTEPGAALRELHQQILTADPALDSPASAAAKACPPPVPRELPAPVTHFAGRAGELAALTALLERRADKAPGTVVISAIGGTAGVGKTALAVQWAHQESARFPDGQLYVNLRGYDPDRPMAASDALAGFLRALGLPGQDIPAEEDQRAARYRSLLAGKRILVVLDNAGSAEQVRPLLPGSPSCAALVTSRDTLAGLVARHGATRLDLDLLPPADATGLLRDLIGKRAEAEPDAVAALARLCCLLPLALRVAAEFTAARPDVPLSELAAELADQQQRLDLLDAGGDRRTAVRAVFSWSYRHLDDGAARTFRLVGLHPGASFNAHAAAALTGTCLAESRRTLGVLTRAHLIQPAGPGRYGMHDLLRGYARELTEARDSDQARRQALTRLFDYYLYTAATAMDGLVPAERGRRPRITAPALPCPPLTEAAAARAWLDAERGVLEAVTAHAARHGWPGHATRLAATLFRYLEAGGHHPEALTIHTHAREAARRAGDAAGEATALDALGVIDYQQGRYRQGTGKFRHALDMFRRAGDRAGEARALSHLCGSYASQGPYQQAILFGEQAIAVFREVGDQVGEGAGLYNLGVAEKRLGRFEHATGHLRQSLGVSRGIGDRQTEGIALILLGAVELAQDHQLRAAGHLNQALALVRQIGHRAFEAEALTRIGDLRLRQAGLKDAARSLLDALAIYRELSDQAGEADALNSLGEVRLAAGQPGEAGAKHAGALRLAVACGDRYQQARAQRGLGIASHAAGGEDRARRHWREALALYTELGVPEADEVRALLSQPEPAGS